MSEEVVHFNQGNVAVTDARFVVGSQTYAMRNVSSVQAIELRRSRQGELSLMIIGAICFALAWGVESLVPAFCGVALIALGVCLWRVRKTLFAVQLVTNSGEVQAVRDVNRDFIMDIVDALNQAMLR